MIIVSNAKNEWYEIKVKNLNENNDHFRYDDRVVREKSKEDKLNSKESKRLEVRVVIIHHAIL